jgi:hypothetical protein
MGSDPWRFFPSPRPFPPTVEPNTGITRADANTPRNHCQIRPYGELRPGAEGLPGKPSGGGGVRERKRRRPAVCLVSGSKALRNGPTPKQYTGEAATFFTRDVSRPVPCGRAPRLVTSNAFAHNQFGVLLSPPGAARRGGASVFPRRAESRARTMVKIDRQLAPDPGCAIAPHADLGSVQFVPAAGARARQRRPVPRSLRAWCGAVRCSPRTAR